MAARYDAGLPPFYEGTHWTYPAPPELVQAAAAGFADPNHFPLDARGLAYHYAYFSNQEDRDARPVRWNGWLSRLS